ncbi:mitochondrial carrier domain-containing protein, partial [Suillus lakei]
GTAVDLLRLLFQIDTVKTPLQSAQGFVKAGGFHRIYKGVGSEVCMESITAAAFFMYETMKHLIPLHDQLAPVNHMLSASMGEVATACLIRVPTEVIKTRMQTSMYGASTSFKAATLVLQHDCIRGFYCGFWTTIMREV